MLLFKKSDLLPVIQEAVSHRCKIVLAKDHGIYFVSEKGEMTANPTRSKHIAYAQGCNPDIDSFDDWWERGISEMGGSDSIDRLDPNDDPFQLVLKGSYDLHVTASETTLELKAVHIGH